MPPCWISALACAYADSPHTPPTPAVVPLTGAAIGTPFGALAVMLIVLGMILVASSMRHRAA